jgi:hypothetical protein
VATAAPDALAAIFPPTDWAYRRNQRDQAIMIGLRGSLRIALPFDRKAVTVIRYRIALDDKLPIARLTASYGGKIFAEEVLPQPEDRVLRVVCDRPGADITLELTDMDGAPVRGARLRVSVLQSVPIDN